MSIKIREKKLKGGRISLYLDIYHRGKRVYDYLGLYYDKGTPKARIKEMKQHAEEIKAKRIIDLAKSEHDLDSLKNKNNKNKDFFEFFDEEIKKKELNKKSTFNYETCKMHFENFVKSKKKISSLTFREVTPDLIREFIQYLRSAPDDKTMEPNTIYEYFGKLKVVLSQAVKSKEQYLTSNPIDALDLEEKPKQVETDREFLTEEELIKIANTPCKNRDVRDGFLFSCFTGLRYSDILKLTWEEIRDDHIKFRQKKTGGLELLPLSETAKNIIQARIVNNVIPLPTKKVFKLPSKTLCGIVIKHWILDAGITKKITFHNARHTFAYLTLNSGTDFYTVSKLLGHRSIKTTQIYAKHIDGKKKAAIDLLPNIKIGE